MARLAKSRNKWIDGVLGGLGNYFQISPDLLRITFLVCLIILDVEMLIPAYILMMIVMPSARKAEQIADEEVDKNQESCEVHEIHETCDGTRTTREVVIGRRFRSGRGLQLVGILLVLWGLNVLLRELAPAIWNDIHALWYEVQDFFNVSRETVLALLLILGGVWLFTRAINKKA